MALVLTTFRRRRRIPEILPEHKNHRQCISSGNNDVWVVYYVENILICNVNTKLFQHFYIPLTSVIQWHLHHFTKAYFSSNSVKNQTGLPDRRNTIQFLVMVFPVFHSILSMMWWWIAESIFVKVGWKRNLNDCDNQLLYTGDKKAGTSFCF